MKTPAPRSLFWQFAGAFLVVLFLGFILQVLTFVWIVGPVLDRQLRAEVGAEADQVARIAVEVLSVDRDAFLGPAISAWARERPEAGARDRGPRILTVFEDSKGWIHGPRGPRPMPPDMLDRMLEDPREFLDRPPFAGREGSGRFEPPRKGDRPDRGGRLGRGPATREERARSVVVVRRPVVVGGDSLGTAISFAASRRPFALPRGVPRPTLFLLPLAAGLAGVAGLWLFRGLTSRLTSLEAQASRVASGDLTERIPDLGRDEIGALGRSLNQMTERLLHSREQLEAEDARRQQFLADVTHELSTPLTSIRGYAETLLDPGVEVSPTEEAKYQRSILGEAERMNGLISELLELVRLEASELQLDLTPLDFSALSRHSVERFRPQFEKKGIGLQWKGATAPLEVSADGRRIEQVLDNLLSNALRYVPAGGTVEVSVEAGPTLTSPHPIVELRVADNGPGLKDEDVPRLFDRFFRGDPSRTDQGTGLGLAIVAEIVRRHGGAVGAENRPEGGAIFLVRLPAR